MEEHGGARKRAPPQRLREYFASLNAMTLHVLTEQEQAREKHTPEQWKALAADERNKILSAPFVEPRLAALSYEPEVWGNIVNSVRSTAREKHRQFMEKQRMEKKGKKGNKARADDSDAEVNHVEIIQHAPTAIIAQDPAMDATTLSSDGEKDEKSPPKRGARPIHELINLLERELPPPMRMAPAQLNTTLQLNSTTLGAAATSGRVASPDAPSTADPSSPEITRRNRSKSLDSMHTPPPILAPGSPRLPEIVGGLAAIAPRADSPKIIKEVSSHVSERIRKARLSMATEAKSKRSSKGAKGDLDNTHTHHQKHHQPSSLSHQHVQPPFQALPPLQQHPSHQVQQTHAHPHQQQEQQAQTHMAAQHLQPAHAQAQPQNQHQHQHQQEQDAVPVRKRIFSFSNLRRNSMFTGKKKSRDSVLKVETDLSGPTPSTIVVHGATVSASGTEEESAGTRERSASAAPEIRSSTSPVGMNPPSSQSEPVEIVAKPQGTPRKPSPKETRFGLKGSVDHLKNIPPPPPPEPARETLLLTAPTPTRHLSTQETDLTDGTLSLALSSPSPLTMADEDTSLLDSVMRVFGGTSGDSPTKHTPSRDGSDSSILRALGLLANGGDSEV